MQKSLTDLPPLTFRLLQKKKIHKIRHDVLTSAGHCGYQCKDLLMLVLFTCSVSLCRRHHKHPRLYGWEEEGEKVQHHRESFALFLHNPHLHIHY